MRKGSGYTWGRAPLNGSKSSVLGKNWARTMQSTAFCVRWQCLYILHLAQCLACRRHTVFQQDWRMTPWKDHMRSTLCRARDIWFLHQKLSVWGLAVWFCVSFILKMSADRAEFSYNTVIPFCNIPSHVTLQCGIFRVGKFLWSQDIVLFLDILVTYDLKELHI